nr:uncharacterized protein LOC107129226 isoform X2 [Macaca fascicularis]
MGVRRRQRRIPDKRLGVKKALRERLAGHFGRLHRSRVPGGTCSLEVGGPTAERNPLGSGKDPTEAKAAPEGQVRVPFLEEAGAGPGSPLQGRAPSLPARHLEVATRRGEGRRPRQACQAETANKEIWSAKQTEPFRGFV